MITSGRSWGQERIKFLWPLLAQRSNVHFVLEDSLWIGSGQLAKSNADQVRKILHVLEGLSLDIVSPDEARQMLELKGRDQVDF